MKKKQTASKFGIGEKVCLKLSHAGFSGFIGGILHPAALSIFNKKEEIDSCLEHWERISKTNKEELLSKPIYLVIFDSPKALPQKNKKNEIIGPGTNKFASVFTFELDIITYDDFWKNEEKKIKRA